MFCGPALFCPVGRQATTGRLFGTHFDGTNGGQDAVDVYGHTISWGPQATLSNTQVKFGATALHAPPSNALATATSTSSDYHAIGTGDFCWQGWVWIDNTLTVPAGTYAPVASLVGLGQSYVWACDVFDRSRFLVNGVVQSGFITSVAFGKVFNFLEVTRISGTVYVGFGGTLLGTFTDTSNLAFDTIQFGGGNIPGDVYWDDWELSLGAGYVPPGGYLIGNTPSYNAAGPLVPFIYPP